MMLAAMLAVAIQLAPWSVKDVTDNNSGTREVSVLQMSENDLRSEGSASLAFDCSEGKVRTVIVWRRPFTGRFVPVSAQWDIGPNHRTLGSPESWVVSDIDSHIVIAPENVGRALTSAVPDGMPFSLTFHRSYDEVMVYFVSDGMKAAYDRVADACSA